MLLTPSAARPWLGPDSRNRRWSGHGAMMIRRREALGDLQAAFGSWARLGLGALAWGLGVGGAVLVGRGVADGGEGSSFVVGVGLLLVATVLGGVVVATGSAQARAVAAWLTLATAVRADGGRVDATTADAETRRAHEEAVGQDRAEGRWELWRGRLLPRTLAVLALAAAAAVLLVRAGFGYAEASTPYAADDIRGAWLTGVLAAAVCLLTAALTASGLRRVHRARMHRVTHEEPAAAADGPSTTLTPALGSGAIHVGGVQPGPAAKPPSWAGPPAAAAPAAPHAVDETTPAGAAGALPGTPPAPAPAPAPPAPASASADGPRIRLADGRELGRGVTLLGRAPRPRPEETVDALLAVADERVSKTHLTVRVDGARAVVVDRGSTNGTFVHRPDGSVRQLGEGEPQELAEGDVVVMGETTLSVGEPAEDVEHTVLRGAP